MNMPKIYHLKAEQVINLRNNVIISEALGDDDMTDDYNDYSLSQINKEDPANVTPEETDESVVFGKITTGLYNYARNYNLANKIAVEIERADSNISTSTAAEFINKLLYGLSQMASQPEQNVAFERFLVSIGVTLDANLLTKDGVSAENKIQ
jgi:hypothetical protein